jgi:putative membrane protein
MLQFLVRTGLSAVALLAIAGASQGKVVIEGSGFVTALIVAIVLGLANMIVKPILQLIAESLTCVLSCLTLGLSSILLSWLHLGPHLLRGRARSRRGILGKDFVTALWGSLVLSGVNAVVTVLMRRDDEK